MNIKNIGLSTSSFGYTMGSLGRNTERRNPQPWTIEQFTEFADKQGFGGIETPLIRFIPDLEPSRLKKLKLTLAKRGMFFIMDVSSALNVEEITAVIPIAKEFGSSIIRIKSSDILGFDRKKLGYKWTEHVQNCITVLSGIAPKLRQYNIKIAIENHQDLDSNDLASIIEAVGTDVVGVTFDIGNAFASCEDPVMFIHKLGLSIINIHLKDYKIFRSDNGFRLARCPLGKGSVDFKTILPLLEKHSPYAKMVIELGALDTRNIAWLEPDFWEEIQPRNYSELIAFFQLLEYQTIRTDDDSWQIPWEQNLLPEDIVSYEASELETSLKYLSTI
jgi:3-oxoisoapionate decarboxylase